MDPRRTKKHFQSEKEAISCFLTAVSTGSYDFRAERIAKSANPLALIAAAQPYSDNYYQAPKPQRSHATSSSTRPSASTRHKGKEIAKTNKPSNLITLQLHGHKIQEVSPEESCSTGQHCKRVEDDSNVTLDSSNICTNDNQVDQNVVECVDERDALANLTLDTEENKTILKQLKKANASLTQELEKCKN
ncbi:hypothetical protein Tco_0269379 [Tanacetum coccineum]